MSENSTVRLTIATNPEDFAGTFDQLEVWRSKDTVSGPWEEITAENVKYARVPATAGDRPSVVVDGSLVVIDGLELVVTSLTPVIPGVAQLNTITFSTTDPVNLSEAASQITTQGAVLITSYVDDNGQLVVESTSSGTSSVLWITSGDAAPVLNLSTTDPDNFGQGREARIALLPDVTSYTFVDGYGNTSFWYRTRYRNRSTGSVSDFSTPFQPVPEEGLSSDDMALGRLELVTMNGRPLPNRTVSVQLVNSINYIDGKLVVGDNQRARSDDTGTVEFSLPRGVAVQVAVAGSSLVKTVTVPTDPAISVFNLLNPAYSEEEDYFKVRVPEINYAVRRSL